MAKKSNCQQRNAASWFEAIDVENELSAVAKLSINDLKKAWVARFEINPPKIRSGDLLLRLSAWQVQSRATGELDSDTERKLSNIARALERNGSYEPQIRNDLSLGVVLTREWKGAIRKVTVVVDGFQYLGKKYGSLADIARTITGTRWSGPRFFGLEQRTARSVRKNAP
jgi:hypothetical protein